MTDVMVPIPRQEFKLGDQRMVKDQDKVTRVMRLDTETGTTWVYVELVQPDGSRPVKWVVIGE
jgi:hypothetical protein